MSDISALNPWLVRVLATLNAGGRAKLMRVLAQALRRSQAERIAAQRNPDGTAYAPRKPRRGKQGKRGPLFAALRTARALQVKSSADRAEVGYAGGLARIARIHQEGQVAPVSAAGPLYRYPVRELLGIAPEDREAIEAAAGEWLAAGVR